MASHQNCLLLSMLSLREIELLIELFLHLLSKLRVLVCLPFELGIQLGFSQFGILMLDLGFGQRLLHFGLTRLSFG